MKLSEAMVLGAAITESKPNDINHCALGMAANAMGMPKSYGTYIRWELIQKQWPWLMNLTPDLVLPLGMGWHTDYWHMIAVNFNEHVFGDRKLTFEQLVDWVRSVEPACGECNTRECTCKKAEVVEVEHEVV